MFADWFDRSIIGCVVVFFVVVVGGSGWLVYDDIAKTRSCLRSQGYAFIEDVGPGHVLVSKDGRLRVVVVSHVGGNCQVLEPPACGSF